MLPRNSKSRMKVASSGNNNHQYKFLLLVKLQLVTKRVAPQTLGYTNRKNREKETKMKGPWQDRYRSTGGFWTSSLLFFKRLMD